MPATVKMYTDFALLPREWLSAVGSERHQSQGHLVVLAFTKKETEAVLTDRGMHQHTATYTARRLRRNTSSPDQMLIDAGVIDPAMPNVYFYYGATKDQPVARIDRYGTIEIVGHFRYGGGIHGRGLWVEPVAI